MDLIKLESQVPLKAYPEKDLTKILIMDFLPWISGLLSLTDQKSADRLELSLPSIKKSCWGMGLLEIKKMFELYADSKLNVKPIPNYFDRILLGKIVNQYKAKHKPQPKIEKPMYVSKDEADHIMKKAIKQGKKDYLEKGIIELASSRYDYLDSKGEFERILNISKDDWKRIKIRRYNETKKTLRERLKTKKLTGFVDRLETKTMLKELENKVSGQVIAECKKSLLKDYYEL